MHVLMSYCFISRYVACHDIPYIGKFSLLKYFRSRPQPRNLTHKIYLQRILTATNNCQNCGPSVILQAHRWTPRSQKISVALRSFTRYCRCELGGLESTSKVGKHGPYMRYSPEVCFQISRYASDHDIAAARSNVSILDTLIVIKIFVNELYYKPLMPQKIYSQNMKISRSTVLPKSKTSYLTQECDHVLSYVPTITNPLQISD